jgi:hypothetical protein
MQVVTSSDEASPEANAPARAAKAGKPSLKLVK